MFHQGVTSHGPKKLQNLRLCDPLYYETAFYANNGKIYPRAEQHGRFLGSLALALTFTSRLRFTEFQKRWPRPWPTLLFHQWKSLRK